MSVITLPASAGCTEQIYSSVALYVFLPIVKSTLNGALYAALVSVTLEVTRDVTPSTTARVAAVIVFTQAGNVLTGSVNTGTAHLTASLSSPTVPTSSPFSLEATVITVYNLSIDSTACTGSDSKLPCNSFGGQMLLRLNLSFI